ncbi:DCC1-like thiol-disulfide oxidoreductase family protein, partial [Maribacter sp. UBA4516]
IEKYQIDTAKTDSILLYTEGKGIVYKSTAALKIAGKLGFPRNLLQVFLVIPPIIRNWIYDYVAKNRYKWFGKQNECMIPTENLKARFLN